MEAHGFLGLVTLIYKRQECTPVFTFPIIPAMIPKLHCDYKALSHMYTHIFTRMHTHVLLH